MPSKAELDETLALAARIQLPDTSYFTCPTLPAFDSNHAAEFTQIWVEKAKKYMQNGRASCAVNLFDGLLAKITTNELALRQQVLAQKIKWLIYLGEDVKAAEPAAALKKSLDGQHEIPTFLLITLALFNHVSGDSNLALEQAQRALSQAQNEKDLQLEMLCQSTLGRITRDVFFGSTLKALPYHEKALELAEKLRDTSFLISETMGIGLNYSDAGNQPKLLECFRKVLPWLQNYEDVRRKYTLFSVLAGSLSRAGRLDEAEKWFLKAQAFLAPLELEALSFDLDNRLFGLYLGAGQMDKAEAALLRANRFKSPDWSQAEAFYVFYKQKGQPEKALAYLEKAYSAVSKKYMGRNASALSEMETQYRTHEKEQLLAENNRQKNMLLLFLGLITLLFAAAVWAFFQQRKSRQKLAIQTALIEKQTADLRHLDEVKSRFFANVSHELRTPLTLILGPISSLLKSENLSARQTDLLKTVQSSGQNLLKLVAEILDLTKMESEKMTLNEQPTLFFEIVERLVGQFESLAAMNGVRMRLDFQAERGLHMFLDHDKFEKLLGNLLSNALKFTPRGGSVVVEIQHFSEKCLLKVSDTGRGIHPDDLPHVFDRYFQTKRPDAVAEGGTGIGLALCSEFARLFGGKIWVESQFGEGSTFFFEWPLRVTTLVSITPDPKFSPTPDPSRGDLASERATPLPFGEGSGVGLNVQEGQNKPAILIVEDNRSLRAYLKFILSAHFEVKTAENGLVALDFLQTDGLPDLILSDLMMPVMDGFQLLTALKTRDYLRQIPVVMLTARADLGDKLAALRIGVDDYLLKPFEEEELLARVQNLLANRFSRQQFLKEIEAEPLEKSATDAPVLPAEEQAWLADLEKVVEAEMGRFDFNADHLATQLAVGRSLFFRRVKLLTGLTPNQYVQEVRFQKAKNWLETGKHGSVKSVAFAVGQRDVQYFSEQFKKRFGKSPSAFLG